MRFNRSRGMGRPGQGSGLLDSSLVPKIEEYSIKNDISDLDALTDHLRMANREYMRHKLGPFRKMVAKAVTVVRRRASDEGQQERNLRRLEQKHRLRFVGGDNVSDEDSDEARPSDGSDASDSEQEELAFDGMEEARHGSNHLNSSLRGFYDSADNPPALEGVGELGMGPQGAFLQEGGDQQGVRGGGEEREGHVEGEGVNRSAPPGSTSGRGVNSSGVNTPTPWSASKAGAKRKREDEDGGPVSRRAGSGGVGLENGIRNGLPNPRLVFDQNESTPGKAVENRGDPSSANTPQLGTSNQKAPSGTREYVPKGPDGTRLRRGKKFVKGLARREPKRGGRNGSDSEGGQVEEQGAVLGASLPKNVWFRDLGGIEGTLDAIRELVLYPLGHPEVYDHLRVQPPRGVLLHGPPGCGKTMLAHAIANEAGVRFLSISAPEVVSGMSGESEAKIRTLFRDAEAVAPALIFIDEIDAITPKRETAQREMERRIVAQLLTCMDALNEPHSSPETPQPSDPGQPTSEPSDFRPPEPPLRKGHVIVIGATNRPDSLDPALRRAGRFDREIGLGIPDEEARVRIMKVIAGKLRLDGDFDFTRIAKKTPGFVGADLQALTTEAAAVAVKRIFTRLGQGDTAGVNTGQGVLSPAGALNGHGVEQAQSQEREALGIAANGSQLTVPALEPVGKNSSQLADMQVEAVPSQQNPVQSQVVPVLPLQIAGNPAPRTVITLPLHEQPSWRSPFTPEQLATLSITMPDFEVAIPKVQPSSKREGFAMIPDVTWADVGSLDEIKEELEYSVSMPIKCPEQFQAMGLPLATGVLLYGPPGCGKTLVAKAIANEAGANFISIKGPELLNKYVGESERAVRQIFTRARDSFPCILFFDEMDALAPKRGGSDGNAAAERVVNQLLTEMDGLEQRKGVYLIAATNRPDMIDPALLRPGRLDKLLYVPLPPPDGRAQILRTLTRKTPLASDLDVAPIGQSDACRGFSGADLAALVREACIAAIKEATASLLSSRGAVSPPISGPPLVHAKHFEIGLAKVSASVSAVDERRYEILRAKLRSSRGHLKPEASREKLGANEGDENGKDGMIAA